MSDSVRVAQDAAEASRGFTGRVKRRIVLEQPMTDEEVLAFRARMRDPQTWWRLAKACATLAVLAAKGAPSR